MGRDEGGTLARLREHRTERLEPALARYGGRLVKLTGDGVLVEFPSAVDALSAAIEFQQAMENSNRDQPEDATIIFRIGLHVGDLIVDGDDLYGDGVNVAARLEGEALPGGIVVSHSVHDAVFGRLKATFADLGNLSLKNIERPIRAFNVEWRAGDWKVTEAASSTASLNPGDVPLDLPNRPSIAVLPFQNMSGDPEQEYFVDGLVEEIITTLSRFSWLMVISRNSTFTYKTKSADMKTIGRELGVRYALEGSIRKSAGRVRITGQLIDCHTDAHLWADRFEGTLENVFDLQDQLATRVVGAIEPTLLKAEIERVKRKPPSSLDAYDHYLRGISGFRSNSREGNDDALDHFLKAVALDPGYASAYGMAAYCRHRRRVWGWTPDREREAAEMAALAQQAITHGKDDPIALSTAGFSLAFRPRTMEAGAALIARACVLNPSEAMAWWMSAVVQSRLGKPDIAIEHAHRAMRLSPLDPNMYQMEFAIGQAHFISSRYQEAASLALGTLQVEPNFQPGIRLAAAACAMLGRSEEARDLIVRLRRSNPNATLSNLEEDHPFERSVDRAAFKEGLRRAGLPD